MKYRGGGYTHIAVLWSAFYIENNAASLLCYKYFKKEEIIHRAPEYLFEKLVPQLKTCRFIYNMLLEKKTNIYTHHERKWEDKLSSDLDWKNIFSQILKITIDTKLRSFQYIYLCTLCQIMKNFSNMVWQNQVNVIFATPQQNLIFTYSGNALTYNRFGVKLQSF